MIGNDVVDLALAKTQSNWERSGFLDKVYSASEKKHIRESKDPNLLVWLFWSMKEAAYKAHQRRFLLPRKLNWQQQECELQNLTTTTAEGRVKIKENTYFTQSEITSAHIHSSAVSSASIPFRTLCIKGTSESARTKLFQELSEHYSFPPESLSIIKSKEGIPYLGYQNKIFPLDFSLSSHGKYASFCSSLMKT